MTYDDLAAMLEPIGVTVVLPGGTAALPCITLEPTGFSLLPGVREVFDTVNIAVRYPLGQGDPKQWADCRATTIAVVAALKGTQVALETDVPIFGEADVQQPCVKYVVAAMFPGGSLCPEVTPVPLPEETEE